MLTEDTASRSLGMQVEVISPGVCETRMTVRQDMVNGHNICHGGFIFALADSAFAFACNSYNEVTVAAGASIDFLRPAKLGDELCARAAEVNRGKRSGLYDISVHDSDKRLIAEFRGRSASLGRPILPTESH
ncbi:MAG: hydroxyphenylacetyl-CoA thioesterase PaaI [Pseudomonadota bacterium]